MLCLVPMLLRAPFTGQTSWVLTLAPPLSPHVTLSNLFNLSLSLYLLTYKICIIIVILHRVVAKFECANPSKALSGFSVNVE